MRCLWLVYLVVAALLVGGCQVEPTDELVTPSSAGQQEQSVAIDPERDYEFIAEAESERSFVPRQISIVQDGNTQAVHEWGCHDVSHVEDFDGDGRDEALVLHILGCGGNCCPSTFSFIDVTADGRIVLTSESMGTWLLPPLIEQQGDGWTVTIDSEAAGIGYTTLSRTIQTFTLQDAELLELEAIARVELPAVAEIRSEARQDVTLSFDLNNDGADEEITCVYADRWGMLFQCELFVGENMPVPLAITGKRIGVLDSTTNGWHDLVIDFDRVLSRQDGTYATAE